MRSALLVLLAACCAPAADPLEYIPKDATLVLKVEHPRKFVEAVTSLDAYKDYQSLPQVKALLDSTTAKRFFQFLALAETKLGKKWPALLDAVAGGGIALATDGNGENAPAVLVVSGTDDAKVAEAYALFAELIAAELKRLSPPDTTYKADTGTVNGADVLKIGGDFFLAHHKGTLVVANKKQAFEPAFALLTGGKGESVGQKAGLAAGRKLLGGQPLAWFWFDMAKAKEDKGLKDFLDTARTQAFLLFVAGSTIDAVRRADFIAGGLYATDAGFKFSVQLPAKRADLPPVMALHAPLKREAPGSLPLLEPPGVLYSQSFYLDVASFWKNRKEALGEQELKDLEAFEKQISAVLPGTTLGKLLEMSGPHHRLVVVERGENQYKSVPDFPLPEMALVSSMTDSKFGKTMTTTLRTAAALASLQFGLVMKEEKHDGTDIVSYRFPDGKALDYDPTNYRYNFVPAFAVAGDSLVVATSPRLLKDVLAELKKPTDAKGNSDAVWRGRGYGAGAAVGLKARPETSVTDSVLAEGVGLDDARKQLDQLAAVLSKLGTLDVTIDHGDKAFKVEAEWKLKK